MELNKKNRLEVEWKKPLTKEEEKQIHEWMKWGELVFIDGKYYVGGKDQTWFYLYDLAHAILEKNKEIWNKVNFMEIYRNNEPDDLLNCWKEMKLI
ncbi:MAG: hypothetical protein LBB39_01385 [Mycoplasmataceae bacterium]|jgi:hypothetical protein|nr:hypothetical protein [Mycoplasmataceae bacterium]